MRHVGRPVTIGGVESLGSIAILGGGGEVRGAVEWARFDERASRETLERIVRGCAAASHTESEFVRALREQGVLVRPRYAEGGRAKVVGYSVRPSGPGSGSDRSIWFGGGRLARDLTLPSLRQGWQQDAGEQAAAVSD